MKKIDTCMENLWGIEEYNVSDSKEKTKKIINKTKKPKETTFGLEDVKKQVKSKDVPIQEKIKIITDEVYRVLGKQKDNIIVIRDKESYINYINDCLKTGIVSVDTETNNTTDTINCDLMGLCLYAPKLKQAYIPVNHIDYETGELLDNQLTTSDIKEGLQLIIDAKPEIIMQNGKFDYQVLKCTCGVEVIPTWDTMIAGFLIDENDGHDLKYMYRKFIDPDQEKYDIEKLFDKQRYAIFPPEVFALYAATDALMTYKVYEYQKQIMKQREFKKIYKLFTDVEMPCVVVTAEMELAGVEVDLEYFARLQEKYNKKLSEIESKVNEELLTLKPQIDAWKLTPEANAKPKKVNKNGEESEGKPKVERVDDPINIASPTQLSILFYDILKCPVVNSKKPRGTGEEELESIYKKTKLTFCKYLLEYRGFAKLVSTYINNIPALFNRWPDHRIRTHFIQTGTDTGRFSSGGKFKFLDENNKPVELNSLNFQNIPSHNKELRMMFKARTDYKDVEITNENFYEIDNLSEILTTTGWKKVKEISIGDIVCGDNSQDVIKQIEVREMTTILYI